MKEDDRQPKGEKPTQPFAFAEYEVRSSVLSHSRFLALVADPTYIVHQAKVDANSYGEFLFVTVSKPDKTERKDGVTFFGLGLHEYRDRYYTREWHFYATSLEQKWREESLTRTELQTILKERQVEINRDVSLHQQSKRGQMFEMIADLTDDDGAITELEDFPDLFDDD